MTIHDIPVPFNCPYCGATFQLSKVVSVSASMNIDAPLHLALGSIRHSPNFTRSVIDAGDFAAQVMLSMNCSLSLNVLKDV